MCFIVLALWQATGLGGTVQRGHETSKVSEMHKTKDRVIRVRFNADVASSMMWNFKPQQTEVKVNKGCSIWGEMSELSGFDSTSIIRTVIENK